MQTCGLGREGWREICRMSSSISTFNIIFKILGWLIAYIITYQMALTLAFMAALLIPNGHLFGNECFLWLLRYTHPSLLWFSRRRRIKQVRGQTYLAHFIFIQSASHYLFSYTGCGCLTAVIQGDFPPPPSEQQGLGGISECRRPLIACSAASLPNSPLPYPRMFCCQSSGI